jgi:Sugar transferases involved in lipopolysaccharide synthesis
MRPFIKRFFDLVMAFIGIVLLFPFLLVIILIHVFRMPDGSIFFIQKRVGRNGRLFKMIKFRTMLINHTGSSVSVKGESRITSFGAFLRKYKIDELPELVNVLIGDMSMVGPRPDVPGYADKLVGEHRLILKLRPGITGPASIVYANEEELLASVTNPQKYNDEVIYPDKVRINLEYYHNNSFFGDLRIIFRTFFR